MHDEVRACREGRDQRTNRRTNARQERDGTEEPEEGENGYERERPSKGPEGKQVREGRLKT